ncbi:MAG: PEP-CTERM sorting domain-containing protein [Alphaproteobacteria bacterium]|nr:PEP-CTERM sorting domain-containing protein [Alphaproteobacteria bacterium]MBV9200270.1 PEP-CTERM sorting domain-containing protein [Alphaproteobacteria bacterium]MBV9374449.1 PEP-CTERM sorting domain-containing protein [Alphaproteobacteria bacterium]MBV9816494.1 PEP-CTERM sorting domain-containing protein [Alphaproteobacteria bacterium]
MQRTIILAAGLSAWLGLGATAYAVCLPNVLPQFTSSVFANGFQQQDCEALPVELTALGPSLVGNADATATGALNLNAIAHANYTDPFPNQGASEGAADAGFRDQFRFLVPQTAASAFLSFTLSLNGSIITVGPEASGSVRALLSFGDQFFNAATAELTAPGTEVLQLPAFPGAVEFINAIGDLSIDAIASAPGNVTVDFANTFSVTTIKLVDANGNILEDNITLTDAAGNVLGGPANQPPPPPPAAPEPSSALLLAAGLGLLLSSRARIGLAGGIVLPRSRSSEKPRSGGAGPASTIATVAEKVMLRAKRDGS